ncbi:MAG: YcxB family protein [Clostridia bacterium]|nr:YcxB family protein [Clostridia bacterium]
MEPLFENRYFLTMDDLREFTWRAGNHLTFSVIAIGALIIALYSAVMSRNKDMIPIAILAVLFSAYVIALFPLRVKRVWQRVCERSHGSPVETITTFTEENAVIVSNGDEQRTTVDYSSIKKTITTKNLIIIVTRARLGYMLRRDGFTVGTEEEFMSFIGGKIAANETK